MINFRRHKTHKHNVEILTRTEIERMLRHTENIKHRGIYKIIEALSGKDPRRCPRCAKELMVILAEIPRRKMTAHAHFLWRRRLGGRHRT